MKSFAEVDRLTIPEYNLLMEAVKLREVDKDYRNHLQAFLNYSVQAQKKSGKNKTKPVYDRFHKFYDYEAAVDRARGKTVNRLSGVAQFLKRKRGGENG